MVLQRRRRAQTVSDPALQEGVDHVERTLRPQHLQEYIGQEKMKSHLRVHMAAAKKRKEPLGHTLLHGPPGLGKTTLAHVIAREMATRIRVTSGPALEKPGDVASLLTNLQAGDILFIDEVHRLRPPLEEILYGAMEDAVLDIVIGKGPTARSVRLQLQPFSLIGATTKVGSISAPLRDRFLHVFKLGFYSAVEMESIVERAADILYVPLGAGAARLLAEASRATPRVGNRLIRAVRDFAEVRGVSPVDLSTVEETLRSLEIDREGLDATDHRVLRTIVESFAGGPVGLSTLAAILAEEEETLEEVYEPYLLQQGYLQRTPKGRIATPKAYQKVGIPLPASVQSVLLPVRPSFTLPAHNEHN
ncbi:Holliday junction branch migration DNA helicase RuvB [Candidatus Peregrinibacteria bacterium]|nr:Holliday junction branch migration DNA helicase RuvB [Candidatus Peregrinibacteria bacterium]